MTFEEAWSDLTRQLRPLFAEVFILVPVKRVRAYGLRHRVKCLLAEKVPDGKFHVRQVDSALYVVTGELADGAPFAEAIGETMMSDAPVLEAWAERLARHP